MELSAPALWWLLSGALIVAELLSGTFYLLMISLGAAAGALGAHAGAGVSAQIVVAALVAGGATAAWHLRRARHPRSAPAASNPDVLLDIGQPVRVAAWQDDGTATVQYRGAAWQARHVGALPLQPGAHIIVAVHGTRLDVTPASTPSAH